MTREAMIVAQTCAKCAASYLGAVDAAQGTALTPERLSATLRLFSDAIDTAATLNVMQQEAMQRATAMTAAAGLDAVPVMQQALKSAAPPAAQGTSTWLNPDGSNKTTKNVQLVVERVERGAGKVLLFSAGEEFAIWQHEDAERAMQLRQGDVVTGNVVAKQGTKKILLTIYPTWPGGAV